MKENNKQQDVESVLAEAEDKIIALKKEKNKLQLGYDLALNIGTEAYTPTVANKETWEKYNRPYAQSAWNKKKGRYVFDDEGNIKEIKTVSIEQIKKESEEFEEFAEQYMFDMTKEDWLQFYDSQIRRKERKIEEFEIDVQEIRNTIKKQRNAEKKDKQNGRPEDFPKADTKKWHFELKEQKEYQHKNGKPFLREIRERIIELHHEETGFEPSIDTIKTQYRKLDL